MKVNLIRKGKAVRNYRRVLKSFEIRFLSVLFFKGKVALTSMIIVLASSCNYNG